MVSVYVAVLIVLLFVAGLFVYRMIRRPWRTHFQTTWDSAASVSEIARLLRTAAENRSGWKVNPPTEDSIRIQCRMNWATWIKEIVVDMTPVDPQRTHIVASCKSPQVFDWGDGKRALKYLRSATSPTDDGPSRPTGSASGRA